MTQLVRVQNFSVSRDGLGAGEGQSLERVPSAIGAVHHLFWRRCRG